MENNNLRLKLQYKYSVTMAVVCNIDTELWSYCYRAWLSSDHGTELALPLLQSMAVVLYPLKKSVVEKVSR